MKAWSDETLMAYADGELDDAQRADIGRALDSDAALRARVAALVSQRARVGAAFEPVLGEPIPPRLSVLLADDEPAALARAPVLALDSARAARGRRLGLPTWAQWGGIAAAVLLGVALGQWDSGGGEIAFDLRDGRLVARAAVARSLTGALASDAQAQAPVAVQLSFVDRSGAYCRTFSTAAVAGLACRQDGHWVVQSLAAAPAPPDGTLRQAASSLPRAVLDAVDARIAGEALDAARERQARDRGWQR